MVSKVIHLVVCRMLPSGRCVKIKKGTQEVKIDVVISINVNVHFAGYKHEGEEVQPIFIQVSQGDCEIVGSSNDIIWMAHSFSSVGTIIHASLDILEVLSAQLYVQLGLGLDLLPHEHHPPDHGGPVRVSKPYLHPGVSGPGEYSCSGSPRQSDFTRG